MAKKNTKIQKQLEEGLQNANQVVDQQIEGKAAPKPAPAAPPTPPAAAAPSAPAAGGTSVPPQQQAPTPELQFEAEIAKIIKGNQYFVDEFRKIRDGIMRNEDAMGLDARVKRLAATISGATASKIPAQAVEGFLTEKLFAQTSPVVRQEVAAKAAAPEAAQGVVETLPAPVAEPSDPADGVTTTEPVTGTYEVSTRGDKRFSALTAVMSDGMTIEEKYMLEVKGYMVQVDEADIDRALRLRVGDPKRYDILVRPFKGKPNISGKTQEQVNTEYDLLWEKWAAENPDLIDDLAVKAKGKKLTDMFARNPNTPSQARSLEKILAKRGMAPGDVPVPPMGETTPSVAPTGLPEASMPPAQTPETQVTATTPDESSAVPGDDVMAMLREADAAMAGTREDASIDRAEARYFGSRSPRARTDEEIDRPTRSEEENADNIAISKKMAEKARFKKLQEMLYERLTYGTLTPEDDLYNLYERFISGEGNVRGLNARNMLSDPESVSRGSLAMRIWLLHHGIGYVRESEMTPELRKLRNEFDAILRSLGIDDDVIKGLRREIRPTRDSEWTPLYFGDQEWKNDEIQRTLVARITDTIQKLKVGGALRRPDVAPALEILTKLITELDSDIIEKRTINFDIKKPEGKVAPKFVDNLEFITDSLAERVKELTGEDIRTIPTAEDVIPRPSWSPLEANGQYFTTNNVINYETKSRRRYALDLAGLIDPRWQEVDVRGLDVPSFINTMNPDPESTKAAIGFILTTDPTTGIHYRSGLKIKRDFKLEGSIIKALKQHLAQSGFENSADTWDDGLKFDSDIGVGDNITYTTDAAVVESEVGRRRLLLPRDPIVIARIDPNKFVDFIVSDGKGTSRLVGQDGILVLSADSPLVQVIRTNGGAVTQPFVLGSEVNISTIAGPDVFSTLLIDIDPHVFPAVRHALPLVDPMNRRGTVALIPTTFAKTGEPVRVTVRDRDGIPSRRLVPVLDENGEVVYLSSGTVKTFSQGGSEGKHKTGQEPAIVDVIPGDTTPFTYETKVTYKGKEVVESRPVLRVRDVDVSASSPDWPEGIAVGIVADDRGNFPNLGTLADRYLADIDEPDVPRRWVLGDLLAVEQGVDRPGRVAAGDMFFGLMHGGITDAELEKGRALIRQIEMEIESGTPHRDRTVLTPEEESLVSLARSSMQPTGGTRHSPARTPYDSAEVFESSEDEWQVKHRERREARLRVVEEGDPITRNVGYDPDLLLSTEPVTPDVERQLRVLKADLLALLKIRATKAFWDRKNASEGTRDVEVIEELAQKLVAIRKEIYNYDISDAAYQKFVLDAIDRVGQFDSPEDEEFFRSRVEVAQRHILMSEVDPVTSKGGYGVSRGFGPGNRTFLSPADVGLGDLSELDAIAYDIAKQMTLEQLDARTGAPTSSLELLQDRMPRDSGTEDIDIIDRIKDIGSDVEEIANLAETDPEAISETPETKKLVTELKKTKDPMFRSLLVALIENRADMRAVVDSAYPEEFAKAVLQEDKKKPKGEREFPARNGNYEINRGLLPDGSRDPYDARMQELWVEYASRNRENIGRKIGKTVRRTMVPADTQTSLAVGLSPVMMPSAKLKGLFSGLTKEQMRIVAEKAYTAFSIFAARDDAGDGWVKLINNVLHADEAATFIGDQWAASGGRTLLIGSSMYADPKTGEIRDLKTQSGSDIGILTTDEVKRISQNSDLGRAYVQFATDNQLNFVVFKKRTKTGFDQTVYLVKLSEKQRRNPSTIFDLSDNDRLTMEYGYQPLADEMDPSQTESRLKTILKESGADRLFDVIMDPSQTGRYTFGTRSGAEPTFDYVIESLETRSRSDKIKAYKMILDTLMKYEFYQRINQIAIDSGVEPPFAGITMERLWKDVISISRDSKGITTDGTTSGPFGIRVAMRLNNKNLPSESIVPRILSEHTHGDPVTLEESIAERLARISDAPAVGDDPMLDASLEAGGIRSKEIRKALTTSREGAPGGSRRRVETETTKALGRTVTAMIKSGRLNDLLNSRGGGMIGGALLTVGLAGAAQGLRDKEREEMIKTGLAFEALGAVSPTLSNAAALGFTAMNKGDMLRTLINIIGGFGGAAVGSIAGTAALPVGGSFAGGMAGSVAGSAVADALYTQVTGGGSSGPQVPYNVANINQQAVPEEKDPFNVFKGLGG